MNNNETGTDNDAIASSKKEKIEDASSGLEHKINVMNDIFPEAGGFVDGNMCLFVKLAYGLLVHYKVYFMVY